MRHFVEVTCGEGFIAALSVLVKHQNCGARAKDWCNPCLGQEWIFSALDKAF